MTKRTPGYDVTLKGFVPSDPKDLAHQARVIDAMQRAERGDMTDALALMKHKQFSARSTSREIDLTEPPPASTAPEKTAPSAAAV